MSSRVRSAASRYWRARLARFAAAWCRPARAWSSSRRQQARVNGARQHQGSTFGDVVEPGFFQRPPQPRRGRFRGGELVGAVPLGLGDADLLAVCGLAAVAAAVLGRAAGGGPVQGPGAARPGAPDDVVHWRASRVP